MHACIPRAGAAGMHLRTVFRLKGREGKGMGATSVQVRMRYIANKVIEVELNMDGMAVSINYNNSK